MRYWLVLVRAGDGRQFITRSVEISESHVVLRGDHVLPTGMLCDLQIIIPSSNENHPAGKVGFQAEVRTAVFSAGNIRLDFRIQCLSDDVRHLISSQILKVAA